jgi:GNAT superfamily N-acetyltransferase
LTYTQIDISEVGRAEEPLVRVLHETIFPEADWAGLAGIIAASADPYLLIAHLEGNPLGYLIATPEGGALRVHSFGVLGDYRHGGIGSRLLARAEGAAKMRGLALSYPAPDQAM